LRAPQQIVATQFFVAFSIVAARLWNGLWHGQKFSATGEILNPMAIAEKPVVSDALEAVWKDMHQKTPQEFVGGQRHHFLPPFVLIVLVSESDLSVFQFFQPVIGNCGRCV